MCWNQERASRWRSRRAPLGVTLSFLNAGPVVNEIALVMRFAIMALASFSMGRRSSARGAGGW